MSSLVAAPVVIAAWSWSTDLLEHREGRQRRRRRQRPVDDLRALARREAAQVGGGDELARLLGHPRDLAAGAGNARIGAGVDRIAPREEQRVAARNRDSRRAGRRPRSAPSRRRSRARPSGPRRHVEREDVADVRRIEAGIRVGERVGVHVAGGGAQRRGLRPEDVRRRPVARRALPRVGRRRGRSASPSRRCRRRRSARSPLDVVATAARPPSS